MILMSDSKRLCAKLTLQELIQLEERVIRRYKHEHCTKYRNFIMDKRNGVYLRHRPLAPYFKYTTSLQFHGYSNDSQLLRDVFSVIPLSRWKIKQLDIAMDTDIPIHQLHAVHPPKRADVTLYRGSLYMGGRRAPVQLHMYDKQKQQWDKHRIRTDTWSRIECE